MISTHDDARAVLRILRDRLASNRARLAASGHDPAQARMLVEWLREHCRREGIERYRVDAALAALVAAGRVRRDGYFVEPA